jgi:hypothetical protein
LIWDLGIDRTRYFETNQKMWSRYKDMGLSSGMFFSKEMFGEDKLVKGYGDLPIKEFIEQSPFSNEIRKDVIRLYEGKEDYLPNLSPKEKEHKLKHMSYHIWMTLNNIHEIVVITHMF